MPVTNRPNPNPFQEATMQSGSNYKPAIRVSLWRNEYAQGERDPFAKGKLSIPLDCLVELLDEWARGTLPVDRDGNAQLNLSAWTKRADAHERAADLSGQATSPADQRDILRDFYQRNPDKTPPPPRLAQPLVPWDLPQSVQHLCGGAPQQPQQPPAPQQGYQPAPVQPYQQPPAYPQEAHAPAPVTTARPLF